jgi:hypothetical protein
MPLERTLRTIDTLKGGKMKGAEEKQAGGEVIHTSLPPLYYTLSTLLSL